MRDIARDQTRLTNNDIIRDSMGKAKERWTLDSHSVTLAKTYFYKL